MPTEPGPTVWHLTLDDATPGEDLVGVGADLEASTLLAAYRGGLFPMGLGPEGSSPLGWWSPDPRGVLLPGELHVSRSLRRSLRKFDLRVDQDFQGVVAACAAPDRQGRWVTPEIQEAYAKLHQMGWAHSVEAWQAGSLVGGLYGVAIGGFFAGESMFHYATDASKACLVGLVECMSRGGGEWLIDTQWQTEHLSTLGVQRVSREEYSALLEVALRQQTSPAWS